MTFPPSERITHSPKNTEDHKLPQRLLFTFFACVYGKFPKYSSVLKILFDIREAREDGDRSDSNLESISKYEKVKQESFWKGTLCNWAWHAFTDIFKLQAPQSCEHARQYNGALCSDPHSGPRVCYSCIWYCTLERTQKASMIIERKHKEWMGACSATKQRAVYPSC